MSNTTDDGVMETNIIVVGGGPVGAFTALIIAKNGFNVTLIEREETIDTSPRAMAFQPSALAEMVEAGVYDDVRAVSVTDAVISWWKSNPGPEKEHHATISTTEGDQPFLTGLNCAQPVFTDIVLEHLKRLPNAKVFFGQNVVEITTNADTVHVVTEGKDLQRTEYKAGWVVGADGGRSTVRTILGIPFEGFTWPKEEFVASNVYYPFDRYGFTNRNFLIDSVNWAIIAKIQNDGLWRVAYGTTPGKTDEEVIAELPQRYKHFLPGPGEPYKVTQVNKYRPHQRCAASLRKGRILLAGDAAHLNNPIGGLGLTTGLLDAGPLARALVAIIRHGAPETLLDKWEGLRRKTWWEQTNKQSIEFKRIAQQGGYGLDPDQIWAKDEVAANNGMLEYLVNANADAKQRDEALYKALTVSANQRAMRARVWNLALPVDWMAEYEEPAVVEQRRKLRPIEK